LFVRRIAVRLLLIDKHRLNGELVVGLRSAQRCPFSLLPQPASHHHELKMIVDPRQLVRIKTERRGLAAAVKLAFGDMQASSNP
jgi:hypothetical protein